MVKEQGQDFKDTLKAHIRHPYPGCIFIGATTSSHQHEVLKIVREACSDKSEEVQTAELHPTLLGVKVNEVRQEIQQAFQQNGEAASSSSSSIASSTSIYPTDRDLNATQRTLILPFAHLLRSTHSASTWSQFLYPPRGYTVIMISSLPFERWKTAEGVEVISGTRPVMFMNYAGSSRMGIEQVLRNVLEDDKEQSDLSPLIKFRGSTFVTFVAAALTSEVGHGDLRELQFLTLAIWSAFEAITSASESQNYQESVSTTLRPLVRSALAHLHTRRMGVDEWIDQMSKQVNPTANTPSSQLSPTTILLLISCFLCSHIPAKYDTRYFLRDEAALPNYTTPRKSKRRKRKQVSSTTNDTEESTSSSILLGPKPFTYQRMMYVYENLSVEFQQETQDIYSTKMISNLQRLVKDQYVIITTPPVSSLEEVVIPTRLEHLNQISLRSNISKYQLQDIVCCSNVDDQSQKERLSWWNRVLECGL